MNNRFFVPVLALGIAALGAAASPSQAATAEIGLYSGPDTGGLWDWSDNVTMSGSSSSLWRDVRVMEDQDGAPTYTEVDSRDEYIDGPGTFSFHEPIITFPDGTPLAKGHSYTIYFVNEGYSGNPAFWSVSTNVGTASRDLGEGTITFTGAGFSGTMTPKSN